MKKILIFTLITSIVIGVPIYKKLSSNTIVAVTVVQAEKRVISSSILASGRVAHEDQVRLTTEVIGKVKAVHVQEGVHVEKGTLLLALEDEAFKASFNQREAAVKMQQIAIEKQKATLHNLKRQWHRKEALFQKKLIDEDTFENLTNLLNLAEIDLKSAKQSLSQAIAQRDQAQDQLNKTRVFSPLTGVVTSLDIKVGETAIASSTNIAGSSLMTIANPSSIMTEVYVEEADIAHVTLGQQATITSVAYPDVEISGSVKNIATSAKAVSGRQGLSFLVKLNIDETEGVQLRPGMSCRAEIFTSSSDKVLSVPIQAITTEEKRSENKVNQFVFVVKDGIAHKTEISTGLSDDSYQQIIDGISAEMSIITGPDKILRHLSDGAAVEIEATH